MRILGVIEDLGQQVFLGIQRLSQLRGLPVYADMRPMIAVSVLSATFFSSLIGLPAPDARDQVGVLLHVRVDVACCSRWSSALSPLIV